MVVIPGPLQEPLMVALAWPNAAVYNASKPPGIRVTYGVRSDKIRQPRYAWEFLSWGDCSAACGGGAQLATPDCVEATAGRVHSRYCDTTSKPADKTKRCNTEACAIYWRTGGWSPCNGCMFRMGVQTRDVRCVRQNTIPAEDPIEIADDQCKTPKPLGVKLCTRQTPCFIASNASLYQSPIGKSLHKNKAPLSVSNYSRQEQQLQSLSQKNIPMGYNIETTNDGNSGMYIKNAKKGGGKKSAILRAFGKLKQTEGRAEGVPEYVTANHINPKGIYYRRSTAAPNLLRHLEIFHSNSPRPELASRSPTIKSKGVQSFENVNSAIISNNVSENEPFVVTHNGRIRGNFEEGNDQHEISFTPEARIRYTLDDGRENVYMEKTFELKQEKKPVTDPENFCRTLVQVSIVPPKKGFFALRRSKTKGNKLENASSNATSTPKVKPKQKLKQEFAKAVKPPNKVKQAQILQKLTQLNASNPNSKQIADPNKEKWEKYNTTCLKTGVLNPPTKSMLLPGQTTLVEKKSTPRSCTTRPASLSNQKKDIIPAEQKLNQKSTSQGVRSSSTKSTTPFDQKLLPKTQKKGKKQMTLKEDTVSSTLNGSYTTKPTPLPQFQMSKNLEFNQQAPGKKEASSISLDSLSTLMPTGLPQTPMIASTQPDKDANSVAQQQINLEDAHLLQFSTTSTSRKTTAAPQTNQQLMFANADQQQLNQTTSGLMEETLNAQNSLCYPNITTLQLQITSQFSQLVSLTPETKQEISQPITLLAPDFITQLMSLIGSSYTQNITPSSTPKIDLSNLEMVVIEVPENLSPPANNTLGSNMPCNLSNTNETGLRNVTSTQLFPIEPQIEKKSLLSSGDLERQNVDVNMPKNISTTITLGFETKFDHINKKLLINSQFTILPKIQQFVRYQEPQNLKLDAKLVSGGSDVKDQLLKLKTHSLGGINDRYESMQNSMDGMRGSEKNEQTVKRFTNSLRIGGMLLNDLHQTESFRINSYEPTINVGQTGKYIVTSEVPILEVSTMSIPINQSFYEIQIPASYDGFLDKVFPISSEKSETKTLFSEVAPFEIRTSGFPSQKSDQPKLYYLEENDQDTTSRDTGPILAYTNAYNSVIANQSYREPQTQHDVTQIAGTIAGNIMSNFNTSDLYEYASYAQPISPNETWGKYQVSTNNLSQTSLVSDQWLAIAPYGLLVPQYGINDTNWQNISAINGTSSNAQIQTPQYNSYGVVFPENETKIEVVAGPKEENNMTSKKEVGKIKIFSEDGSGTSVPSYEITLKYAPIQSQNMLPHGEMSPNKGIRLSTGISTIQISNYPSCEFSIPPYEISVKALHSSTFRTKEESSSTETAQLGGDLKNNTVCNTYEVKPTPFILTGQDTSVVFNNVTQARQMKSEEAQQTSDQGILIPQDRKSTTLPTDNTGKANATLPRGELQMLPDILGNMSENASLQTKSLEDLKDQLSSAAVCEVGAVNTSNIAELATHGITDSQNLTSINVSNTNCFQPQTTVSTIGTKSMIEFVTDPYIINNDTANIPLLMKISPNKNNPESIPRATNNNTQLVGLIGEGLWNNTLILPDAITETSIPLKLTPIQGTEVPENTCNLTNRLQEVNSIQQNYFVPYAAYAGLSNFQSKISNNGTVFLDNIMLTTPVSTTNHLNLQINTSKSTLYDSQQSNTHLNSLFEMENISRGSFANKIETFDSKLETKEYVTRDGGIEISTVSYNRIVPHAWLLTIPQSTLSTVQVFVLPDGSMVVPVNEQGKIWLAQYMSTSVAVNTNTSVADERNLPTVSYSPQRAESPKISVTGALNNSLSGKNISTGYTKKYEWLDPLKSGMLGRNEKEMFTNMKAETEYSAASHSAKKLTTKPMCSEAPSPSQRITNGSGPLAKMLNADDSKTTTHSTLKASSKSSTQITLTKRTESPTTYFFTERGPNGPENASIVTFAPRNYSQYITIVKQSTTLGNGSNPDKYTAYGSAQPPERATLTEYTQSRSRKLPGLAFWDRVANGSLTVRALLDDWSVSSAPLSSSASVKSKDKLRDPANLFFVQNREVDVNVEPNYPENYKSGKILRPKNDFSLPINHKFVNIYPKAIEYGIVLHEGSQGKILGYNKKTHKNVGINAEIIQSGGTLTVDNSSIPSHPIFATVRSIIDDAMTEPTAVWTGKYKTLNNVGYKVPGKNNYYRRIPINSVINEEKSVEVTALGPDDFAKMKLSNNHSGAHTSGKEAETTFDKTSSIYSKSTVITSMINEELLLHDKIDSLQPKIATVSRISSSFTDGNVRRSTGTPEHFESFFEKDLTAGKIFNSSDFLESAIDFLPLRPSSNDQESQLSLPLYIFNKLKIENSTNALLETSTFPDQKPHLDDHQLFGETLIPSEPFDNMIESSKSNKIKMTTLTESPTRGRDAPRDEGRESHDIFLLVKPNKRSLKGRIQKQIKDSFAMNYNQDDMETIRTVDPYSSTNLLREARKSDTQDRAHGRTTPFRESRRGDGLKSLDNDKPIFSIHNTTIYYAKNTKSKTVASKRYTKKSKKEEEDNYSDDDVFSRKCTTLTPRLQCTKPHHKRVSDNSTFSTKKNVHSKHSTGKYSKEISQLEKKNNGSKRPNAKSRDSTNMSKLGKVSNKKERQYSSTLSGTIYLVREERQPPSAKENLFYVSVLNEGLPAPPHTTSRPIFNVAVAIGNDTHPDAILLKGKINLPNDASLLNKENLVIGLENAEQTTPEKESGHNLSLKKLSLLFPSRAVSTMTTPQQVTFLMESVGGDTQEAHTRVSSGYPTSLSTPDFLDDVEETEEESLPPNTHEYCECDDILEAQKHVRRPGVDAPTKLRKAKGYERKVARPDVVVHLGKHTSCRERSRRPDIEVSTKMRNDKQLAVLKTPSVIVKIGGYPSRDPQRRSLEGKMTGVLHDDVFTKAKTLEDISQTPETIGPNFFDFNNKVSYDPILQREHLHSTFCAHSGKKTRTISPDERKDGSVHALLKEDSKSPFYDFKEEKHHLQKRDRVKSTKKMHFFSGYTPPFYGTSKPSRVNTRTWHFTTSRSHKQAPHFWNFLSMGRRKEAVSVRRSLATVGTTRESRVNENDVSESGLSEREEYAVSKLGVSLSSLRGGLTEEEDDDDSDNIVETVSEESRLSRTSMRGSSKSKNQTDEREVNHGENDSDAIGEAVSEESRLSRTSLRGSSRCKNQTGEREVNHGENGSDYIEEAVSEESRLSRTSLRGSSRCKNQTGEREVNHGENDSDYIGEAVSEESRLSRTSMTGSSRSKNQMRERKVNHGVKTKFGVKDRKLWEDRIREFERSHKTRHEKLVTEKGVSKSSGFRSSKRGIRMTEESVSDRSKRMRERKLEITESLVSGFAVTQFRGSEDFKDQGLNSNVQIDNTSQTTVTASDTTESTKSSEQTSHRGTTPYTPSTEVLMSSVAQLRSVLNAAKGKHHRHRPGSHGNMDDLRCYHATRHWTTKRVFKHSHVSESGESKVRAGTVTEALSIAPMPTPPVRYQTPHFVVTARAKRELPLVPQASTARVVVDRLPVGFPVFREAALLTRRAERPLSEEGARAGVGAAMDSVEAVLDASGANTAHGDDARERWREAAERLRKLRLRHAASEPAGGG